ncbi:hypothetical protein BGZ46_000918 [Entomortierella lignicola]|nr:hypothetical protein BGZ46_000918 [Entomortierella lignicola]
MSETYYQLFLQADTIEKVCVRVNNAFTSDTSSPYYVSMEDIQDVFPQAIRFKLNGNPVPFLIDLDGRRIEPLRIAFYPDDILEVITDTFTNTSVVVSSPTNKESNILSSQQILSTSSSLLQSLDSSRVAGESEQAKMLKSDLARSLSTLENHIAVSNESSQEMKQVQIQITEVLDRMVKMQLEAKEKDDKMILMQDQLLDLQNKTYERLAILQKHVHAILVQSFELHEYPVPRLFIILPVDKSKWDPTRILENKFRLHFLCECGNHAMESSKNKERQIHLVKHEGYEIKDSTEFFKKYGKYILILMQALKTGMRSLDVSMPHIPTLSGVGIDYSISYMEALSVDNPSLSGITTIEDYEELGGADLRQLVKFLRVNDQDGKLGNLYRITIESGHVIWVCIEHYQATYEENEQKAFTDIVKVNGGEYDEELGRVVISLGSRTMAQEFFHALVKARHVYELDVTFDWNCSTSDLEALEKALRMSTVSILRLDLRHFQASVARKLLPVSRHHERITRIIEQKNMKVIHIVLSKDFIKHSGLQDKAPHVSKLSIEMNPQSIGPSSFRALVHSITTNTSASILDLGSSSIGSKGAKELSEALKGNTTLISLNLELNSIGDAGAIALSKALETNTALKTLNLELNSIGNAGAIALSEAFKNNNTLTTLNLELNSIGNTGALALSKALSYNTSLTIYK